MKRGIDRKVSEEMQSLARKLDQMIEEVAGEPVAFTLLIFTEPRASYISSAPREQSVQEIKHLLSLWEQGMPDVPAHKFG